MPDDGPAARPGSREKVRSGGPAKGRVAKGAETLLRTIRRIAGMPDHAAHVEHLREHHPGAVPLGPREHFEQFIARRYADGRGRCC